MKVIATVCVFIVLALIAPNVSGKFLGALLNNNNNNMPTICVINVQSCKVRTPVCGRYGASNLCQRFENTCALKAGNCGQNIAYTPVNMQMCNGIALNTRRACATTNGGAIIIQG